MNSAPSETCKIKLPERAQIDRALAQASLMEFVEQAWVLIEPGGKFVNGRHIEAIVEHLEAVTRGQIRNLLINVPFRCCKSLLVSVFWMCWEWTNRPETRWLYSSYIESLAIRDSVKCRRIIESQWYKRNWGDKVKLTGDQNAKQKFENDRTGYRMIMSQSSTTGEGGDRLVVDDPHAVMDGFYPNKLNSTINWFDEAWSSRYLNPETVTNVVIGQRIAPGDLSGHLKEKGGWEHLMLPMRFEKRRACVTGLGWSDWRKEEGELLWPEWLTEKRLLKIENDIGPYATAGQLQQAPAVRGGNYIAIDKLKIIKPDKVPILMRWVRSWDLAAEDKQENDFTAGAKVAMDPQGNLYIGDMARGQWKWPVARTMISSLAVSDKIEIGIEAVAGFLTAYANLLEVLPKTIVCRKVDLERADKLQRALPWIALVDKGMVFVVEGDWNAAFIRECEQWQPSNKNAVDDQIDAVSNGFKMLSTHTGDFSPVTNKSLERLDRPERGRILI